MKRVAVWLSKTELDMIARGWTDEALLRKIDSARFRLEVADALEDPSGAVIA